MWFIEGVVIALQSIWVNKLRSILTLIGMIIGVTTVITVVSVINGMNNYVATKINSMGSNTFIIDREGLITSEDQWFEAQKRKRITIDDMKAVQRYCSLCETVGGASQHSMAKVKYGADYLEDVMMQGVTYNFLEVSDVEVDYGRALIETDEVHRASVCLVGPDIVSSLIKSGNPIGKDIKIGKFYFRIVGVAKARGSFMTINQDNWVIIPLTTYEKYFSRRRTIAIYAKAARMDIMEEAQDEARMIMRTRRKLSYDQKDDFGIMTSATFMELFNNFTRAAWFVLVLISSISLVVGGIVIMNIMLVSVTERTREIGIRKAIGARRRDILWQFLVEAVTLSIIGGSLGILLGIAFAMFINQVSPLPAQIELWAVILGLAVSSSVGIIFGIFPAVKAARLDPIEALRYE
ncbi:MAG: ABC transporter permease [candidate division Zixibacteria bacterium]